jgi:plastocyanin
MTRLALLLAAALAALAGPAAAQAMEGPMDGGMGGGSSTAVEVMFGAFGPQRVDVVAGDSVRWSNASVRTHTVTADDGSWGSARLFADAAFSHRFLTSGRVAYYCTLHPFMTGEVDVHRVLLAAPAEPGAPGKPYTLRGRAALPAGEDVTIEADTGSGFARAGSGTVGTDGAFTAEVTATTTATYRAVAADEASPGVQLVVLDRKLTASAAGNGRSVTVNAGVAPASPGAPVVLQLRLPQHFGWWPVARAKLDRASRARFSLRLAHRYPARVLLTLADGATALATSRTLHVGPH